MTQDMLRISHSRGTDSALEMSLKMAGHPWGIQGGGTSRGGGMDRVHMEGKPLGEIKTGTFMSNIGGKQFFFLGGGRGRGGLSQKPRIVH